MENKNKIPENLRLERLVLRPVCESDVPELLFLRSDPETNQFVNRKLATSTEDILQFLAMIKENTREGKSGYWALSQPGSETLMGTICLFNVDFKNGCGEIGYELLPQYRGQGLMTEALQALIRLSFDDLQLNYLEAWSNLENHSSIKLLERSGFRKIDQTTDGYGIYQINRSL